MSQEENQGLNEVKEGKKCNCSKLGIVLIIISLLFSITALVLSTLTFIGHPLAASSDGGKVVISQQYDKGRSLEKALKTKKPVIVFFYTDWCGFCQRFAPVFDKITKDKKIKNNFAIAFVNCEKEENHKLMEEYDVHGFPTVFVIDKNGKKTQLDNNTFFNDKTQEVVRDKALELIEEK